LARWSIANYLVLEDTSLFSRFPQWVASHRHQGLLNKLDVIENIEHPGKAARYVEITKKQRELYRALEVDVPA
jgi:hypothetical protein